MVVAVVVLLVAREEGQSPLIYKNSEGRSLSGFAD